MGCSGGGVGVAGGGGSPESNQDSIRAHRSQSGVGEGGGIKPHGSCTRFCALSELDVHWNGADGGGGGGEGRCDPPVS